MKFVHLISSYMRAIVKHALLKIDQSMISVNHREIKFKLSHVIFLNLAKCYPQAFPSSFHVFPLRFSPVFDHFKRFKPKKA